MDDLQEEDAFFLERIVGFALDFDLVVAVERRVVGEFLDALAVVVVVVVVRPVTVGLLVRLQRHLVTENRLARPATKSIFFKFFYLIRFILF